MSYKIILASASPRRCEIMKNTGFDFTVLKSNADESSIDGSKLPPEIYVQELALLKATDVVKKLADKKDDYLVIGADTIVHFNGKILGKPVDETDACNMLKLLSGNVHEVFTGFSIVRASDMTTVCKSVKTSVRFDSLSNELINAYVRTGEPMDKAGAYGIQGKGAVLVDGIEGDYLNVVGLPVKSLAQTLNEEFGYTILD